MPIAFDTAGSGINTTSNTVLSWTHTIGNTDLGILVAIIGCRGTPNVTNLAYQGQNMTAVIRGTSSTVASAALFYLVNPPTGLGTFNGTFSAANAQKLGVSMVYTGVQPVSPISGSVQGTTGTVTSGSIVRAPAANNWFVGGMMMGTKPGTTSTGNQRSTGTTAGNNSFGVDSTGGTLRWTSAAAGAFKAMVGAELVAFPGRLVPQGMGNSMKPWN